ncbi:agamous-like MADS-box protein AP3 [Macadamia integrifolia]|uniref:agamous-like MADS-box protein AP3 n=1 Tax=Macadamia integrifolia TaxID=60698 RepID=UPI001C4E388F|nr:agamous-like MADS-box protein AP3 [Macadamia integrifolia]
MGGGKLEIKRIENDSNWQVTDSKRRNGIIKKAWELDVLCDAQVSLIMLSRTGKFHEFVSPSTTTKKIFDRYQETTGINLWQSHYEKMQESLNKLKEINNNLRGEIRQRIGEDDLDGLSFQELRDLEQNMDKSLKIVRDQKCRRIQTQTDIHRKKLRNSEGVHRILLSQFERRDEDLDFGLVDHEGHHEFELGEADGGSHSFAFQLQPIQPDLQEGVIHGLQDLHLA